MALDSKQLRAELDAARKDRTDFRALLKRSDARIEDLQSAHKRIGQRIERLRKLKHDAGPRQSKHIAEVVDELRKTRVQLEGRIDTNNKRSAKRRKVLGRLRQKIDDLKRKLKHRGGSPELTMYDSVTVSEIPTDAKAAAGYTSGYWPTWNQIKSGPWPYKLSIAINVSSPGEALDCEPGDASPDQVPAWVKHQLAVGVKRPVVYTSVSAMQDVLNRLSAAGVSRSQVRVWTAHYTFSPHRCTPSCGYGLKTTADATQFSDKALGRNLDASLVAQGFFN